MKDNVRKLQTIWKSFEHKLSREELRIPSKKKDELLGVLFCPGPFYYYLMDFADLKIVYIHQSIEDILGVSPEGKTLNDFIERLHPDDFTHFANCEKMATQFLFNHIKIENIPRYKVSYSFRLLNKDNEYKLFLHQAISISVDSQGKLGKVLGIHTDISHIVNANNHKISFIDLQGKHSYIGIKVIDGELNLDQTEGPFSQRETEIIRLLADGYSAQEVAKKLFLSYHTIRTHRQNILRRLNCRNTTQLIAKCIRNGYI